MIINAAKFARQHIVLRVIHDKYGSLQLMRDSWYAC